MLGNWASSHGVEGEDGGCVWALGGGMGQRSQIVTAAKQPGQPPSLHRPGVWVTPERAIFRAPPPGSNPEPRPLPITVLPSFLPLALGFLQTLFRFMIQGAKAQLYFGQAVIGWSGVLADRVLYRGRSPAGQPRVSTVSKRNSPMSLSRRVLLQPVVEGSNRLFSSDLGL